jgi:hypothetical protein
MKEFEELSAQQLDRLVDGELSDAERRELLQAADREPDGWRRVALAFVESQALRRELSELMRPLSLESPDVRHRPPAPSERGRLLRTGALVACSLLAFGVGRWTTTANERIARDSQTPAPSSRTFADDNTQNERLMAGSAADAQRHQTLRLVFDDEFGGPPQAVEVPVVDEASVDPTEFLNGPPAISPEIQRALLRAGRRVREERQLYEVQLSDGRRGVVPVSNVLVENAGLDVFQ